MALVDAADYDMLDYICGMERDAPQNLRAPYKALPPQCPQPHDGLSSKRWQHAP